MTDWKAAKEAAAKAIWSASRGTEYQVYDTIDTRPPIVVTGSEMQLLAALDALKAHGFVIIDWNRVRDLGLDGCVILDDTVMIKAAQADME